MEDIETKKVDFHKKFIDTEELQSEIIKLKNSILNSLTVKGTSDTAIITNIKSINNNIIKSLKEVNSKIADLYAKTKESQEKIIKITQLEAMINTNNTARISKDEKLKREIDDVVKTVA